MNIPDIQADVLTILRQGIRRYPQHTNRASSLDDPCTRRLVYQRTHWDQAQTLPDYVAGVFFTGRELEPIIDRQLSLAGAEASPRWRLTESQAAIADKLLKQYQISGHIDGLLEVEEPPMLSGNWNRVAVADVKTCNQYIFDSIDTYDDLDKRPWTKKYRGQLMIYALAYALDQCVLILVNKNNLAEVKPVVFELDFDYVEGLLGNADEVNYAVDSQNKPGQIPWMPDRINDPEECRRCPFEHICCPTLADPDAEELTDPEIEDLLDERAALQEALKRYIAVTKRLKNVLPDRPHVRCGRHVIDAKHITTKAYDVKAGEYWKRTYSVLDDGNGGGE